MEVEEVDARALQELVRVDQPGIAATGWVGLVRMEKTHRDERRRYDR